MKLIIDIPEMAYEAYKEWHKNKVATAEQSLIANGIPYEEKPKYFPPCEDCNKKMEEIRQAYDKMKAMERPQGETNAEIFKQTLVHEIVHGMLTMIGRNDLSEDETFVQSLALAISQTFDLKGEQRGAE